MREKRILIVGAGIAGKKLLKEIISHKKLQIQPIGFIDDDKKKVGKKILDIPVLGTIEKITSFIQIFEIDKVFIALPSIDGAIISNIVKKCLEVNTACQIVPRYGEILEGKVNIKALRDIKIDDLLGRPLRMDDFSDIPQLLRNETILVTGAAGSIGSELCRQIASYQPKRIIMYDWWENGLFELGMEFKEFFPNVSYILVVGSIQDKNRIESVLKQHKPSLMFHAAAYKHVPLMEENAIEAIKNNVIGTKILTEAAKKAHVKKFVFISTDKAVNPKSIMGVTKLLGEYIIHVANNNSKTKFLAVRFGNVLDSAGSVLPLFKKQLEKTRQLTITHEEMTRYFMTIPEAVQLILKATILSNGGEIFLLDMGDPIKIVDLAKKFILLSGLIPEKDVKIIYIGLRPGEKLKEELIAKGEDIVKTKLDKILMIKKDTIAEKELETLLEKLTFYCKASNQTDAIKTLGQFFQ